MCPTRGSPLEPTLSLTNARLLLCGLAVYAKLKHIMRRYARQMQKGFNTRSRCAHMHYFWAQGKLHCATTALGPFQNTQVQK